MSDGRTAGISEIGRKKSISGREKTFLGFRLASLRLLGQGSVPSARHVGPGQDLGRCQDGSEVTRVTVLHILRGTVRTASTSVKSARQRGHPQSEQNDVGQKTVIIQNNCLRISISTLWQQPSAHGLLCYRGYVQRAKRSRTAGDRYRGKTLNS